MKSRYEFSILRYVYDPLTQEFVNVGLALYAPEHGFLRAMCTAHSRRVSHLFHHVDRAQFRSLMGFLKERINAVGELKEAGDLLADPKETLSSVLKGILPEDDSAFRFQLGGVGFTDDPLRTLTKLYRRYISRYEKTPNEGRRGDEAVWRVFREPLEKRELSAYLAPKKIVAPNYEYQFERAWKNGIYHLYEPVSFDLSDASEILDKANRWVGRATSLKDSTEPFKLFLLLGEPTKDLLQDAFLKASNILETMPVDSQLIKENEAEQFSEQLEAELKEHGRRGVTDGA